ncbi:hypothetical protein NBRC3293_0623 [Gluconobacter oxydans NBRC 3293]|uniref:Uncharacterized protein n=1 Tax=Gluconobacter oxydans NBRC 3293 TaxID=1315969 RepID=A0A829X6H9_GLUOY|nr:hypothetical protein NBRC3293_0623 [Gluconobacter oxydans NBRC 3293]
MKKPQTDPDIFSDRDRPQDRITLSDLMAQMRAGFSGRSD